MRNDQTVTVRRADYRPPDFLLDHVALEFDLDPALTYVTATLDVRRNPVVGGAAPLRLDGEDLDLALIAIDGHALPASAYQVRDDGLNASASHAVKSVSPQDRCAHPPVKEHRADGTVRFQWQLFHSMRGGRIPSHHILSRPARRDDDLSGDGFVLTKVAVPGDAPPMAIWIEQGDLSEGRHFATWDDPFAKP